MNGSISAGPAASIWPACTTTAPAGATTGPGPNLARALAGRDPSRECVLLAHQPRAIEEAARQGVGLQLSGHTHGGQLWPFGFFVRLAQPYVAGLHRHGDSQIYVNPGTGYWGPPMRLGTRAEITKIILRAEPLVSRQERVGRRRLRRRSPSRGVRDPVRVPS